MLILNQYSKTKNVLIGQWHFFDDTQISSRGMSWAGDDECQLCAHWALTNANTPNLFLVQAANM